jgi:outer membrane protein assembly factor BamB
MSILNVNKSIKCSRLAGLAYLLLVFALFTLVLWGYASQGLLSKNGAEANAATSTTSKVGQVKFSQKWVFKFNETDYLCPPVVGNDGTVFFAKDGGYFFTVNSKGKQVAKVQRDIPFTGMALGNNNTAYFCTESGYLYAVDARGKTKWQAGDGDSANLFPAIAKDGTIYYGDEGGDIFALKSNGKVKWKVPTTYYTLLSMATIGKSGTIYFGDADGGFYALQPNGKMKWKRNLKVRPLPIDYSPRLVADKDDNLYFSCYDGLCALNSDGSIKWQFKISEQFCASPAIGKDGMILVASGKKLYAITRLGSKLWECNLGKDEFSSTPVVDKDGVVYVLTLNKSLTGTLFAVKPDGKVAATLKTDAFAIATPAIDKNGTLYMLSLKGKLYAINTH